MANIKEQKIRERTKHNSPAILLGDVMRYHHFQPIANLWTRFDGQTL